MTAEKRFQAKWIAVRVKTRTAALANTPQNGETEPQSDEIGLGKALPARLPSVDAARGFALWAMFVFHLVWDLAQFGWIERDAVFAPEFRWFGHAIAACFLLLVGVSLVLARRSGPLWRSGAFWRRWSTIVAAAAAISAVSFWLFPETPIFFGILHCIALATLLALPLLDAPLALVGALAAACLLAPRFFARRPSTARFSGGPACRVSSRRAMTMRRCCRGWRLFCSASPLGNGWSAASAFPSDRQPQPVSARSGMGIFAFFGRHSLAFYLIHQPILFGCFTALSLFAAPPIDAGVFLRECAVNCVNQGVEAGLCEKSCACLIDRAKAQGFWEDMARDRMNAAAKRPRRMTRPSPAMLKL